MAALEKISQFLNRVLILIAGCFLGGMVVLTCANIFLRIVWKPVMGTFELMGYSGAIVAALALGYTQTRRGHIAVDLVVLGFSKKTQRILNTTNSLICMIFFIMVAWQVAKYATTLWKTGEVTETLQIIYYPFTYSVALGCVILSMVFLIDFVKSVIQREEDEK
jgi:TRAP-type C4-dicarboxylate transport system permease small subunit